MPRVRGQATQGVRFARRNLQRIGLLSYRFARWQFVIAAREQRLVIEFFYIVKCVVELFIELKLVK